MVASEIEYVERNAASLVHDFTTICGEAGKDFCKFSTLHTYKNMEHTMIIISLHTHAHTHNDMQRWDSREGKENEEENTVATAGKGRD